MLFGVGTALLSSELNMQMFTVAIIVGSLRTPFLSDIRACPTNQVGRSPSPPPGTIQSPVADLGSTGIQPAMTGMPTPNSAACSESVSMDLANPAMMAPANATGAAATPGVTPQGC
jgi:hypothetical protein